MPAPMRPMPTIPISTSGPSFAERRSQGVVEQVERARAVQADAHQPPALGLERLGVAGGLRRHQGAEGIVAAGHVEIAGGTVDQLDEAAGVWAALVVLGGGVEGAP